MPNAHINAPVSAMSEMTDREIAEETLQTLREIVVLVHGFTDAMTNNPMLKNMARMFG